MFLSKHSEAQCSHRLVKMVSHRVSKGPDGVVEDQQVLVLVLAEGKHQCVQNEAQVGHQLCTGLLFQSRKRTDKRKNPRINSTCLLKHHPD